MRNLKQRFGWGSLVAVLFATGLTQAAEPGGGGAGAAWQPAKGPLMSKFAKDVQP